MKAREEMLVSFLRKNKIEPEHSLTTSKGSVFICIQPHLKQQAQKLINNNINGVECINNLSDRMIVVVDFKTKEKHFKEVTYENINGEIVTHLIEVT